MSSTPASAARSILAPGACHTTTLPTPPAARPGHINLVRLRPDDLPTLTRVPLAQDPRGTRELFPCLHQVAVTDPPQAWARATANAEHRIGTILGYLWDRSPADVLAPDALVELDLKHGGRTVYSGLRLDETTHYVWTYGSPPPTALHSLAEIVQVSGVCMFCATGVMAVTGSGQRIPITGTRGLGITEDIVAIEHDRRISLSEAEGILRLGTLTASIGRRIPARVPLTLQLDMPYLSYPLYGLPAAYTGQLPVPLLAAWADTTFARHHRLVRRQIAVARAASAGGRPMRIRVRPELWRVALWLRRELAAGHLPSYEQLLDRVSREGWLWRHLIEVARPDSPLALAYLIHVAAMLRAAWSTANQRRLMVQVDDPKEWRILDRSLQVAKLLREVAPEVDFPMLALRPMNHMWVQPVDGPARPDPYVHDPGHVAMYRRQPTDLLTLAASHYPSAGAVG